MVWTTRWPLTSLVTSCGSIWERTRSKWCFLERAWRNVGLRNLAQKPDLWGLHLVFTCMVLKKHIFMRVLGLNLLEKRCKNGKKSKNILPNGSCSWWFTYNPQKRSSWTNKSKGSALGRVRPFCWWDVQLPFSFEKHYPEKVREIKLREWFWERLISK